MISDQNSTTRSLIATLITCILKSHNLIDLIQELHDFGQYHYILNQEAGLSKSETRNAFTSHFENISASSQRDVIGSCDWLFFFFFIVLFSFDYEKLRQNVS